MCCIPSYSFLGNGSCSTAAGVWSPTTLQSSSPYYSAFSPMPSTHLLLKLDFKNAFNTLRRDKMIEEVKRNAPELFAFILAAYGTPSLLFCGDHTIASKEGCSKVTHLAPSSFASQSNLSSLNFGPISAYST